MVEKFVFCRKGHKYVEITKKNRKNEIQIIFDHSRVIFRSIFGGSKSSILSLKTSFVKNVKKQYFGSEKIQQSIKKIVFSGKFTDELYLPWKSRSHKSDDF